MPNEIDLDESNAVADAFHYEDWEYFKRRFGKLPTCHAEAEMIMDKAIRKEMGV